jgi:hypothetical protein
MLGGFVLEEVGLQGAYFAGAVLYSVGFFMILRMACGRSPTAARGPGFIGSLAEGLRYVRGDRALVGTMAITIIFNVFGFPFTAMIPVIGKDVLGLSPFPVGLLMSADGAGAFICAVLLALFGVQRLYRKYYFFGAVLYIVWAVAVAQSPWALASGFFLFIVGFGQAGFATMQSTLVFLSAPPEIRARVMGVLSVCIGAAPLGFLHIGLLADWLGAVAAATIVGIEGLLALIVVWVLWPEIR